MLREADGELLILQSAAFLLLRLPAKQVTVVCRLMHKFSGTGNLNAFKN